MDAKKAGYTPQEYDKHFIAARGGGVGVQVLMSIGSALRKVRKEGTRMTSRARGASAIEGEQARDRAREAGANASWRSKALPAGVATLILGALAIGLGVPATSSATASPPECALSGSRACPQDMV